MAEQAHGRWSKREDEKLVKMRAEGVSIAACVEELGRCRESIIDRCVVLNAIKSKIKLPQRRCMKPECREWFTPGHKGEYFHPTCKPRAEDSAAGVFSSGHSVGYVTGHKGAA